MPDIRKYLIAPGLLALGLLVGCQEEPEKPLPVAIAAEGPNQVVLFVPTMVCESCPEKVREGLAMLPWIDTTTIHTDRKARQVRFTLKDRSSFDFDSLKEIIARKGFRGIKLLAGPTAG